MTDGTKRESERKCDRQSEKTEEEEDKPAILQIHKCQDITKNKKIAQRNAVRKLSTYRENRETK